LDVANAIVHKKTGKQKHRQMRLVSMLIFRPCEGIAEITLNNDFLKDAILRDMQDSGSQGFFLGQRCGILYRILQK
jgi:hypothetical protein